MILIALFLLGSAIALWRYGHHQGDDVLRFLSYSTALVCLMAGLVAAPGLLKFLLFTALIIYPACTPDDRVLKPECPRFCLLRRDCKSRYLSSHRR